MTTTKKGASTRRATTSPAAGPSELDLLYKAHQVHTLAQITYRQLAAVGGGFAPGPMIQQPLGFGAPWSAPFANGAMGAGCNPQSPSVFYWYP